MGHYDEKQKIQQKCIKETLKLTNKIENEFKELWKDVESDKISTPNRLKKGHEEDKSFESSSKLSLFYVTPTESKNVIFIYYNCMTI